MDKVRARLLRATVALEKARIAYAVIGGQCRCDLGRSRAVPTASVLVNMLPAQSVAPPVDGFLHAATAVPGGLGHVAFVS